MRGLQENPLQALVRHSGDAMALLLCQVLYRKVLLLLPSSPVYTPLCSKNLTTGVEVVFSSFINILTFLLKS